MKNEEFTFQQKWFPTVDDAIELARNGHYIFTREGQLFGRWTRSLVLAGALILGGYQCIGNNIVYSEGQIVGVVNKSSEKGVIWKTKESQLSLEGRTSTGDYTGAGVWDFSIDRLAERGENVDELFTQIRQEMENGRRVKITYHELLATWPWRAGTTYLIQSVEPLETRTK